MAKQHFICKIVPVRKEFVNNPTKEEEEVMADHFLYLKSLLDSKKLVLAGPSIIDNDAYGILIFETDSIDNAREMMENDPSIQEGVQKLMELRPIRLSLFRNI